MGRAIEIVEKIMNTKDYYTKGGLIFPQYVREWKRFNMLVGENGSGKSRVLKMIKENIPKDYVVFYLDFANCVPLEHKLNKTMVDDENLLIGGPVFNERVGNEVSKNFLELLDSQIIQIFYELSGMMKSGSRHLRKRVEKILNELDPCIQEILHRDIVVKSSGIYLRKAEREIHISNEWPLLSPGERSALLIILSILFIKLETTPCILLIDELETHLHPEAQVKLYKLLKQTLNNAQVDCCTCIASHSVFLLPLFEIQELVYMNNGTIGKLNGGLYQQIYDNLIGEGDKKEESLTDFLYSMSAWQFAAYLAQCFLIPTTVDEVKSDDEQTLQFVEILKELYDRTKTIEVLDFGAGTVRIGKCIELMLTDNIEVQNLIVGFKYHVYDKNGISDEFRSNSAWRGVAYHTKEEISFSNQKFHLVLLYNVLHEIGIDEWVKELSFIMDSLAEEGYLIFGEREILSVGEKPYGKSGYLVLGKEELLKLFPKSKIEEIILPEREKTATVCFAVKKPDTKDGYPNAETVKAALHLLKENTKNKIRNREINGLGKKGHSRRYAFYCQQYVNVEEAIEIMDDIEKRGRQSNRDVRK